MLAERASLELLPLVLSPSLPLSSATPSLEEILGGPLFSVPLSLGQLLPSHMLLHKLLPPPPFPSLSSLLPPVYTHTPLQTHSPIVFSSALPQPSGFQMRPAEQPTLPPTQLTHPACLREG